MRWSEKIEEPPAPTKKKKHFNQNCAGEVAFLEALPLKPHSHGAVHVLLKHRQERNLL